MGAHGVSHRSCRHFRLGFRPTATALSSMSCQRFSQQGAINGLPESASRLLARQCGLDREPGLRAQSTLCPPVPGVCPPAQAIQPA
jgi:hypothetical protein